MTAPWRTPAGLHTSPARLPVEGRLPSFDGATGWLNSPPLTAADLSGKIVLVNFWTYTCINWLRQLPYVRAWVSSRTVFCRSMMCMPLRAVKMYVRIFGFQRLVW